MTPPERLRDAARPPAPPAGTVEAWCWDLLHATEVEAKLAPPAPPDPERDASWEEAPPRRHVERPGRPSAWTVVRRSPKTPRAGALVRDEARAALVHTFLHHELQAAELFARAILAFPDAPRAFRAGLLRLAREELGHLALYRAHLARLGHAVGAFPVRDWFWERVPRCDDPLAFVSLVGLGLEGANLEHAARFAAAFRAAGDGAGAAVLERVERDEVGHVAFAARWFRAWTGGLDFDRWAAELPVPLTPSVLRNLPLNRAARERAGLDAAFLDRLAATPDAGGAGRGA